MYRRSFDTGMVLYCAVMCTHYTISHFGCRARLNCSVRACGRRPQAGIHRLSPVGGLIAAFGVIRRLLASRKRMIFQRPHYIFGGISYD